LNHFLDFWRYSFEHGQYDVDLMLAETEDHKERLERHFDNSFPNKGGAEEDTEWNQEMPA